MCEHIVTHPEEGIAVTVLTTGHAPSQAIVTSGIVVGLCAGRQSAVMV